MDELDHSPGHLEPALTHEALLYCTIDGLCAQAQAFVGAAVERAEPVMAVLGPASLEPVRHALGAAANDVHWAAMAEVGRNPSCLLALYQDWLDAHPGRVRVIAEPIWPERTYAETVECLRHEALLNHELAAAPLSALCPYDAAHLVGEALAGAELTHPQLVDDAGNRRASASYGEPLEVAAAGRWPQDEPGGPITEHQFAGDLRSLRHAVADDPIARRLGRARRADLVFALSEAASNAVKHGDGTCTARLWGQGDGVVGEIVTHSVIDDVVVGRRRPKWDATDGRGLWLINQVCDLVELRSHADATVLRMHLCDRAA